MINKYPGNCADCGERVAAGAGTAVRDGARWTVRCGACDGAWRAEGPGAGVSKARADTVPTAALERPAASECYTLMSGHPASPYQVAVFDHFRYGRGSRIVRAVAGSGKTTTMKNALRWLPEHLSVQMLAFNVEAADQLKAAIAELAARGEKIYRSVRANSFNSLGMGAVRRALAALPDAAVRVDPGKCRRLLAERATDAVREMYSAFACRLVGLAKGEGVGCLRPDTEDTWYDLVDHHGLYLDSQEATVETGIAVARDLLRWSCEVAREGWLDYDDQMYLVVLWKMRLWRNDVVVVDEAQDTNPVQRAMLHLALKDGGRLYAVGDERQAIYGFRGASADAMDLIASEFRTADLPLTVSYRCARAVVERAQTWVPHIEPSETAPAGKVRDDVPLAEALDLVGPEDAVLCRQTAPLVSVAYGLIARGRACRILGREIGEGLVNLVEQQKARGVDRLVAKLEAWRDREAARFVARGEEGRAEAVEDRVACVLTIVGTLPETDRTVPALVRRIREMFQDPARGEPQTVLTLATVHKAKGKEWSSVVVLRPELMPSRAARQGWQESQEYNLMYVAATRAKTRLIYCAAEDMTVAREEGQC